MNATELARRRRRLMKAMGKGAIGILPTAPARIRNRDVEYPYRADSDFYYLTGLAEPDAVAVLAPGRKEGAFVLFCRERDPKAEVWTGRRVGVEGALADYGADQAHPIGELDEVLPGLLENRHRVYYTLGRDLEFDQRVLGWLNRVRHKVRAGVHAPEAFLSMEQPMHELRLVKSKAEVRAMRKAARISARGHRRAMGACRPGLAEYQLEAELLHEFVHGGSRHPAYPSIVGGGANACVLHYTENGATLEDGDLVLIDAGCEYAHYASDITRTFPVNGRFSDAQRAVYDLVLAAQEAAIAEVRPGKRWNDPHDAAVKVLTRGLVDLGLLQGKVAKLIEDEAYRRFYMHRTGHWLGLDVHDVGDYKVDGEWRLLEPGMVMTVEPGLYIPAESEGVPEDYWNIGVRIEDDVLVTENGHEVLSGDAPKRAEDIEALMAR
jgi:Xaa-Pro aminopeptidase